MRNSGARTVATILTMLSIAMILTGGVLIFVDMSIGITTAISGIILLGLAKILDVLIDIANSLNKE